MHLAPLIRDLAIILGMAGFVTLVFQKIRQPVVLGYLVAGMIIGPYTPPYSLVIDIQSIHAWADLGVVFLMFTLGLEFSFRKLSRVGVSAGMTACIEVLFMVIAGYGIGKLLGWSFNDSLFLGAMLSISSTTIIIKALDELNLKGRKFSELVFGVLIVEDLVAILLLVALSTLTTHPGTSGLVLLNSLVRLIFVVSSWFLVGYFIVPRVVKHVGKGSDETLTLVSIGLCLGLVVLAVSFQYSPALGAFIMGSIIAESVESHRIEALMEPIKNVFGAVFFVSVGMLINPKGVIDHLGPILIISLVTVLGKITTSTLGSLITGQSVKVSTQVGFSLAQIGEFSFIIAGLGASLKVTSDFLYPVGVAVSLITTFTTPYLIRLSEPVARGIEDAMPQTAKRILLRYSSWIQEKSVMTERKSIFIKNSLRWFLNGLATTLICLASSNLFIPILESGTSNEGLANILSWSLSILISSPFIWGMFSTFRQELPEPESQGLQVIQKHLQSLALLISRFLSLLWIGSLSLEFFEAKGAALVTIALLIVFTGVLYRQIESTYQWFEGSFLSTFKDRDGADSASSMNDFAPWNAHLVSLKVHPNSVFSGKKLLDTELRNRYGINVVVIQRGIQSIIAPKPDELVFPNDELLILGTDESIDSSRQLIEGPAPLQNTWNSITNYELKSVYVSKKSPLAGKSIRHSGIRDHFSSMVVGIERNQSRIMSPISDMEILVGDILWVVGEADMLKKLSQKS